MYVRPQFSANSEDSPIATTVPARVYRYRRLLNLARWVVKLGSGSYFERPALNYAVYLSDVTPAAFRSRRAISHRNGVPASAAS